ncbi:AAA family ATPase [Elizabethkingia anophelis]|uniref:AAA family ATPase n=1 Tax=Elizabethkingia anophelis TaxID=1117645 RepID=UPI00389277A3
MDNYNEQDIEHLPLLSGAELLQIFTDKNESIVTITSTSNSFSDSPYSGFNLFQMEHNEIPKLVDPIFQKVGLASLVGSSDLGKSTFLRQLILHVALGIPDFIGYKINTNTNKAIYISTEDDPASVSSGLKKQINSLKRKYSFDISDLNNIKFIFNASLSGEDSIYNILQNDLQNIGADIVVFDAFTDIFSGDLNSSTKVREFLNAFNKLALEHNCLFVFLHHTGKRTSNLAASKDNVLGSQAFEAKMRVLLELKAHHVEKNKRTLHITKANYISSKIKATAKILSFNENDLLFEKLAELPNTSLSMLSKNNQKVTSEISERVSNLHSKGNSYRKIEEILKSEGFKISKSTIGQIIKQKSQKNS